VSAGGGGGQVTPSGRFVVFEGGEGSGKSTQAARLAARMGAVLTREPGGTDLGAALRTLLLDPSATAFDPRAEALLMAADRAQHVAEVIRPALAEGRHVVCDRFVGSSIAYQGAGRGVPVDVVAALSRVATGGLVPELVLLLVVTPEESTRRLDRTLDRFESAGVDFHARVAADFVRQAEADPTRWAIVDGGRSIEAVEADVAAVVAERLGVGRADGG
jgi:dTMP kinase